MGSEDPERKHPIQKLMDNPWLLLVLGVVIPTLSIELAMVPPATLP
jgi:hypothetical protein